MNELEEMIQKVKNLKLKVEQEIEKTNNSYKIVEEEITLSFTKQHLELEKNEKKLKLELNLRVKQIKEELGKYLEKVTDILLFCGKTYEMAEKCEKKINNDIKTLYYISKINKSNEKAKEFVIKKIKTMDISFNSDKYVFYEDYYFNGIPFPKNIKAEKKEDKLHISWDIDNSFKKYMNLDNIKYIVLVKCVDYFFEFTYETNDKYFNYDNYNEKMEYEIKVRTILDDCKSDWSEIKKCKYESSPIFNIFDNNNQINLSHNTFGGNQINKKEELFGNVYNNNEAKQVSFFGDIYNKNPFLFDNINNNQEKSTKPLFSGKSLFSSDNNLFDNKNQIGGLIDTSDNKGQLSENNNNQKAGLFQINNDNKDLIVEENNKQEKGKNEEKEQ